jgi:hypothetical protein
MDHWTVNLSRTMVPETLSDDEKHGSMKPEGRYKTMPGG